MAKLFNNYFRRSAHDLSARQDKWCQFITSATQWRGLMIRDVFPGRSLFLPPVFWAFPGIRPLWAQARLEPDCPRRWIFARGRGHPRKGVKCKLPLETAQRGAVDLSQHALAELPGPRWQTSRLYPCPEGPWGSPQSPRRRFASRQRACAMPAEADGALGSGWRAAPPRVRTQIPLTQRPSARSARESLPAGWGRDHGGRGMPSSRSPGPRAGGCRGSGFSLRGKPPKASYNTACTRPSAVLFV